MTEEEVISEIRDKIMDLIEEYEHPNLAIIAMQEILTQFAWANYEIYKDEELHRTRDPVATECGKEELRSNGIETVLRIIVSG